MFAKSIRTTKSCIVRCQSNYGKSFFPATDRWSSLFWAAALLVQNHSTWAVEKSEKVENLLSSKSSKLFEWENTRCGCYALWWSVTVQQCIPQCPSKWRKMQKHAEQSNCSMWSCVVGWQGRSTAVEFTRMFYTQRHLLLDTSLFSRVHWSAKANARQGADNLSGPQCITEGPVQCSFCRACLGAHCA